MTALAFAVAYVGTLAFIDRQLKDHRHYALEQSKLAKQLTAAEARGLLDRVEKLKADVERLQSVSIFAGGR